MRDAIVKLRIIPVILYVITGVIILLPFHALLTVWAGSNFGHYTLFRLWKEILIFIIGLLAIYLLIVDKRVRQSILSTKVVWIIGAYLALELVMGIVARLNHSVSTEALAYGLLDDLRFLAFFIICWLAASYSNQLSNNWIKLIIWPAIIVIGFGLLQMTVLPANVLTHFGYGPHTIMPYETINQNRHYIRILSTLRGANPLGAYLIVPISVLAVLLIRYPKSWNWAKALLLLAAGIVLFGSYSRAAWIGAVLSCLFVGGSYIDRALLKRFKLPIIIASMSIIVLLSIGALVLSHSSTFQNIIFHTQTNSAAPISSDQAHLKAVLGGINKLASQPLGDGPGVSGPASVYNHDRPARIPENYFLEIGEESGVLGMLLFIAINIGVASLLWHRRQSPFALALLAAFIGITFVNLLSLAWTDDTLSYLWWGLAGIAMALPADRLRIEKGQTS